MSVKHPDQFIFLASLGVITEEDIEFILIERPKLIELLVNYDSYKLKYRERIIANTIKKILSKYKKQNLNEKIKLLNLMITTMPKAMVQMYVPHIAEILAEIEIELKEKGLLDIQLQNVLNKLYESLHKDKPKINEILAHVSRLYAFVKSKETIPSAEEISQAKSKPSPKTTKLLIKLLQMVDEAERAGSPLTFQEATKRLYNENASEITTPAQAYIIVKNAIKGGYIKQEKGRLYLTEKGKDMLT